MSYYYIDSNKDLDILLRVLVMKLEKIRENMTPLVEYHMNIIYGENDSDTINLKGVENIDVCNEGLVINSKNSHDSMFIFLKEVRSIEFVEVKK